MDILAEVLSSASNIELNNINEHLSEIKKKTLDCQKDVMLYMEKVYVRFEKQPHQNNILFNKCQSLEEEISNITLLTNDKIKKELDQSNQDLQLNKLELERINFVLQIIFPLIKINELLTESYQLTDTTKYYESMKKLQEIKTIIKNVPDDECLDILISVSSDVKYELRDLNNKCMNILKDSIQFSTKANVSELKLIKSNELNEALRAAHCTGTSSYGHIKSLAKFVSQDILTAAINQTTESNILMEDDCAVFKLTIKSSDKPKYNAVYTEIKKIVTFLFENFNLEINDTDTIVSYIGNAIQDDLSKSIIYNCLEYTIPSTNEGMASYKVVIADTESLQKSLVECKIFREDTTSILEYANNIDILFINKLCKEFLIKSKTIMKKDLHDMIEVGTPYDSKNAFDLQYTFLQCSVSKSAKELFELLEEILEKVLTVFALCGGRLFYIVEDILLLYGNFVLDHHKKLLQTIPQQVALFHNNCMYLANNIESFHEKYGPRIEKLLDNTTISFGNCTEHLQDIGQSTFTQYVQEQCKQISAIMKGAGLNSKSLEKVEPITEKSIRQCLRQQELLKTVWSKVLSYTAYNKSIGEIFDCLCVNLINSIVIFEDISSDSAEQLVEIIKIILTRGPKLFSDSNEVSLYVPSWYKLNEVSFILRSNLVEINDRWADGKGPLAMQFVAKDLKQMIRALFQNTDRRAALLTKIQKSEIFGNS